MITTTKHKKKSIPEVRRLHVIDCSNPVKFEAFLATLPDRSEEDLAADKHYQRLLKGRVGTQEEVAFLEDAYNRSRGIIN